MSKKEPTVPTGFTIVELMIAVMLAAIVMFGVGAMVVDGQRGWQRMYNHIYSDVATDSYVARKTFDSVVRKASSETFLLDAAGSWIEVYYYEDPNSAFVDSYARFSYDGVGQLDIEYGRLNPRQTLTVRTVCENVSSCVFKASGRSAQMILTLDDGLQTATIVSSSVMHNQ